jgi:hypothetical protein
VERVPMRGRCRGALVALLTPFAAVVSACGDSRGAPPHLDTNLVVVTACGLRSDLLEEACARGSTPALARLRADAAFAATVTTTSLDCLAAHAALPARAPPIGIVGPASDVLPARGSSLVATAARRARSAVFSFADARRPRRRGGGARPRLRAVRLAAHRASA